MRSDLKKVARTVRDFALSMPGAWEDHPWGENVAKVGKKVFVFMGHDAAETWGVSVKLRPSHASALKLPFTERTGYGLGKAGWVSAEFRKASDVPLDVLFRWIEESYVSVAPKKLAKELAEKHGALPPATQKPKRRRG